MKSAKRKTNRLQNIQDMEAGYDLSQALAEASRCLLCYDPPCSQGCPAGTDPGKFIWKLRVKNIKGAIRTIKENNILGGVCGVACPTEQLCQEACSATELDRPIEIGKLQRFLVEHGWATGFDPLSKGKRQKARVAVVGSGPAGLACAADLAQAGVQVTVFEAREEPGGVLRYGVPRFRLHEEFLGRELQDVTKLGVKFKCGAPVKPGGVEKLKKRFDAVFVAPGIWKPYTLALPGAELANVTNATDFLETARSKQRARITRLVRGKNVAIIGGGSVAMDVANTCKGLGAGRVYCLCLEDLEQIPSSSDDLQMALDNHVIIKPQSQVTEILGQRGRVGGVKGSETEWIEPGSLLPSNARAVEGTDFSLRVSVVVVAIGAGPDPAVRDLCSTINYAKNGLIKTHKDGVSTRDKQVFAGGDIARGPALIVDAVADGKEAAARIIKALARQARKEGRNA